MNTVTGGPTRRPAHADRPAVPRRALLLALAAAILAAGVGAALVHHAGSVPSEPGSAQRITVPARTPAAPPTDPT